jgi:hypothetical protein
MQTAIPAGTTFSVRRSFFVSTALLLFGFAQPGLAQAQTNPLVITNTYFVTGDYVVGGWQKPVTQTPQTINGVPYVTATISIPDPLQPDQTGLGVPNKVPVGADIVAAYLYWETVESTSQLPAHPGQSGFFNGHAFTGSFLPSATPNAPTSWSSGGCSGSAQGAKTIQGYRADIRPFLPLDTNSSAGTFGDVLANGNFTVLLADSGSNGNTTPFTLGATLVVIYRVLNPTVPLNSIVLYDGIFAPSNTTANMGEMSQQIMGFYQAAASPVAKLTHIVGAGQPKKDETVLLNNIQLPSLYSDPLDPFPGIYAGSWDNPTWLLNHYGALVKPNDPMATTSVVPTATGGKCLDWGAVVFSSTVQDTDGDGLLDAWEDSQGYTDAISGQFVALPGADKNVKDIFAEIDYLSNVDGKAGNYLHSHLPKQQALDEVGDAFKNAPVDCDLAGQNCKGVHIHFDVGPNYKGNSSTTLPFASPDPYIIQGGTGGNAISESAVVCNDGGALCQFPGQVTTAFKGDLLFVRNNATDPITNLPLGNFQSGRGLSYHYVLFGHSLGEEESLWTTFGAQVQLLDPTITALVNIVNNGTTTTVTINSPSFPLVPLGFVINPGDCTILMPPPTACSDNNVFRVTVEGALGQPALNGTYVFTPKSSSTVGTTTTTSFTIPTVGVPPGTYDFTNEPQLSVSYLGPTSSGGHSDFGGGGDSLVTFGSWTADDPANCQADPSQPQTAARPYCNNELGSVQEQAGTLMHELGHTLTLTHGGTYYKDAANPSVPIYGLNCKSNFLSSMSYLFVIRGFPDNPGIVDYSGQTFSPLDETTLNESTGIGLDSSKNRAQHFTRWFAPPNALDKTLGGGRFPIMHCDGSPIGANEPKVVRVNGSTFSSPIDWDNDLAASETDTKISQDVNFNGITDAPFDGFSDWQVIGLVDPATGERGPALRQINARAGAFGLSGSGGTSRAGGGTSRAGGGTSRAGGGTSRAGGGTSRAGGGSTEQDVVEACSTADPLPMAPSAALSGKSVVLTWTAPDGPCQVRSYDVRRAQGSFPTLASVIAALTANPKLFTDLTPKGLTGTPPMTTFTDMSKLQNNTTYTYIVTATNAQGATSRASDPVTILVTSKP